MSFVHVRKQVGTPGHGEREFVGTAVTSAFLYMQTCIARTSHHWQTSAVRFVSVQSRTWFALCRPDPGVDEKWEVFGYCTQSIGTRPISAKRRRNFVYQALSALERRKKEEREKKKRRKKKKSREWHWNNSGLPKSIQIGSCFQKYSCGTNQYSQSIQEKANSANSLTKKIIHFTCYRAQWEFCYLISLKAFMIASSSHLGFLSTSIKIQQKYTKNIAQ